VRGLQRFGLENLQPSRLREALYRARDRKQAAAGSTVGLGKNQTDLVPGVKQAQQRPLSESRCAGKD
jgi:hypothetical protein